MLHFFFRSGGVHLNKLSKQKSINYCASVARKCETNRTTNRIGEKRATAVCSNEQFPCGMKWQIVIGRIQFSCGTNSFMLFIFCSLRFFFSPHFFPGLRRLYIVFLAVVTGSSLNVLDWNYKIISCHNRTNPLFIRVCIRFVNSLLCRRLCVIMFSTESETMQEH